jgi:hypothetical protein
MSWNRKTLVQSAMNAAIEVRMKLRLGLEKPICVYDECENLGLSVWFQDVPSMEGLYLPDAQPRPAIVVSSLRPAGRQSMTCGHELGHHQFGHGEQWDELTEAREEARKSQPEEFLVDVFSAMLHMPKLAVCKAAALRAINLKSCPPVDIYRLSRLFGVGYSSFIIHANKTLDVVPSDRATELLKHRPLDIRSEILGDRCEGEIVIANELWLDRPIDLQIGDYVVTPAHSTAEGDSVEVIKESTRRRIFQAVVPGISRIQNATLDWSVYVRVSRKNYSGRAPYRFDKEVPDET